MIYYSSGPLRGVYEALWDYFQTKGLHFRMWGQNSNGALTGDINSSLKFWEKVLHSEVKEIAEKHDYIVSKASRGVTEKHAHYTLRFDIFKNRGE